MKMEGKSMDKEILQFLDAQGHSAVKMLLDSMNVVDIAEELESQDSQQVLKIFRMLSKDAASDVFAYLTPELQQLIIEGITDKEINRIIDDLFLDDAVDFIEEMPASVVKRVLKNAPHDKREMINHFLQYPEDSVGSVMTIEYIELKIDSTVADAFSHIRETGMNKETVYTCYVIDPNRKLVGMVSILTLLLAEQNQKIEEIMDQNIISAKTKEDRETLMISFRKYDLLAMPVTDNEDRLVGIVTVDDIIEVQKEENTEDFELMAAMSPSEEPYLKTSVLKLTKNRVVWLLILMLSATLTGYIISDFEDGFAVFPALVAFIPMLMNTGGNAGSQSSTLIIRGMALEEISLSNAGAVLWKELRVAVLCGAALVCVNFIRIMIEHRDFYLASTVSLSLYATVLMAKSIGCLLPMVAKKLNFDPALMSSPVITTLVDATSLIVYFNIAKVILKI